MAFARFFLSNLVEYFSTDTLIRHQFETLYYWIIETGSEASKITYS